MILSKNRRISMIRIQKGLSMRQLAVSAGVNVGTISCIESKPKSVTPQTAKRVCDALGVRMEDVFEIRLEGIGV